jgi:hypothetical protein
MKLFKQLLVAGAAVSLIAPLAAQASDVNLEGMNSYSRSKKASQRFDSKSFVNEISEDLAILKGRVDGLEAQQNNFEAGSFSSTTSASFGADFVLGSIDGATSEGVTFEYQFGMDLSTSFTGEDELALTIETGNGTSPVATALDMNAMSDAMTVDGISYTFPLGDKTTILVGDSTDVSTLYSTACTYSAFTDRLSDCGTGTSAGLGGGTADQDTEATSDDASSATIAAAYDFGNGFTIAGGMSGAGGDTAGLFTKQSLDVYGLQAAYNTDNYGLSVSYALTEGHNSATEHPDDGYDTTFWGLNGFYSFEDSSLPSISVGYEAEDRGKSTAPNYPSLEKSGFFVGLTWADLGPGSLSTGLSSVTNYQDSETEYYQYEAAYSYPVNDGMTVTPGVFIKETSGDDETGVIVTTSFSF